MVETRPSIRWHDRRLVPAFHSSTAFIADPSKWVVGQRRSLVCVISQVINSGSLSSCSSPRPLCRSTSVDRHATTLSSDTARTSIAFLTGCGRAPGEWEETVEGRDNSLRCLTSTADGGT